MRCPKCGCFDQSYRSNPSPDETIAEAFELIKAGYLSQDELNTSLKELQLSSGVWLVTFLYGENNQSTDAFYTEEAAKKYACLLIDETNSCDPSLYNETDYERFLELYEAEKYEMAFYHYENVIENYDITGLIYVYREDVRHS